MRMFPLAGEWRAQLEGVARPAGDHQQPGGCGEADLQGEHQPLHLSVEDSVPGHLLHRRGPCVGGWSHQLSALLGLLRPAYPGRGAEG